MAAPRTVGRREMLAGAGMAAGGLAVAGLATAAPAAAHEDDDKARLDGSWLYDRQNDDGTERAQGVFSFAGGNVMIVKDNSPAGPPFTGTWERREGHHFVATVWSGFPGDTGPGSAGPSVRVRLRGEVEDGRLEGTYRVTGFAPMSETVIFTATGTFSGRRIRA